MYTYVWLCVFLYIDVCCVDIFPKKMTTALKAAKNNMNPKKFHSSKSSSSETPEAETSNKETYIGTK